MSKITLQHDSAKDKKEDFHLEKIKETIISVLKEVLHIEENFDQKMSFRDLGLDSVGAVESMSALTQRFSISLDSVAIYDYPTLARLSQHIYELIAKKQAVLTLLNENQKQKVFKIANEKDQKSL